ncbi:FAD-dependent monooxygenase [Streptomyces spongiae]|uniref:FAD-binding protein n=1 Tax=Streptomyces spongiae TaxID=565072 RepID=A0A5N8XP67_9ACTN|nr:FAD-dependent monooxygenase [Streptomyces spongiae]MPY60936.1 FAD-binding protein [Streptomyces spongiae]
MTPPTSGTTGRALVVGAGIAGMATAIRLRQAGWQSTIVERSPNRRTGGYFIGLYPGGRNAAKSMGVYEHIHTRTPVPPRTWEVDSHENRTRGFGLIEHRDRPDAVLRGDIEEALWTCLDGVPVRFGVSPARIDERTDGVDVQLRDIATDSLSEERFDLVVGADGLRSTVRTLVFGEHKRFMKPLNAIICAFQLQEQVPHVAPRDNLILAEPGRSLWVFAFKDRAPTALLAYRTKDEDGQFTRPPREVLRDRFADVAHAEPIRHALEQLDQAPDLLFDSVHQVRMESWHTRRVVLMGDAAWCISLYSGQGASAGLLGADTLGRMIEKHPGDLAQALAAWERELRPFVRKQQFAARVKGHIFVPGNRLIGLMRRRLVRWGGKKLASMHTGAAAVPASRAEG